MNNITAFWMALVILCIAAIDGLFFNWSLTLEIGRLIMQLSDWMAFWR